jgi:hypothetical protein
VIPNRVAACFGVMPGSIGASVRRVKKKKHPRGYFYLAVPTGVLIV